MMRKVTSIPGSYAFEGKAYGPFEASGTQPYTEVPEDVQKALNLPLHDSDPDEASGPAEVQGLGELNPKLVQANTRIAELEAERVNLIGAAETNAAQYGKYLNIAQGLAGELEASKARIAELEAAPASAILPEDAHARLVAIKGIGEKLANEVLSVLTESAQP